MLLLSLLWSSLVVVCSVRAVGLNDQFTWTRLSYQWPRGKIASRSAYYGGGRRPVGAGSAGIQFEGSTNTKEPVQVEANAGNQPPAGVDYQYVNNIPMGANVWQDKLFITVPRRRMGVPSSLNYIPLNSKNTHNVPLIPYPSWSANELPTPGNVGNSIVSVYRVAVDPCDRLWFVDTGIIETLGNTTRIQPQAVVVIDLKTDKTIRRFEFPQNQQTTSTILAFTAVDVTKDTCDDAYAYFPDLGGYHLLVYSFKENKSWRVNHNYFFLEPMAGEFFIAGHRFMWNDGIFSVQLSDVKTDGFRDLYFHAMSGVHEYKVSTRILRNESLATRSYHGNDFQIVGFKGENMQTSAADLHKPTGVTFLGLVNKNAVGCWNINTDLKDLSFVHMDEQKMIYPSDVKVSGDKVYVLTNTMPGFLYGRLNYDEVNFRVWSNTVEDAIKGTNCDVRNRPSTGSYGK